VSAYNINYYYNHRVFDRLFLAPEPYTYNSRRYVFISPVKRFRFLLYLQTVNAYNWRLLYYSYAILRTVRLSDCGMGIIWRSPFILCGICKQVLCHRGIFFIFVLRYVGGPSTEIRRHRGDVAFVRCIQQSTTLQLCS